jgi:DNA-binding transcriptional ArsR family regulator
VPSAWAALADPHRRVMLELLRESPRPVGELVERTGLTQPGTSKHLRVLRDAGLVISRTEGQQRIYALDVGPLVELDAWLEPYRQVWERRLDALERHLDRTANPNEED